jgi:hypothetical protein
MTLLYPGSACGTDGDWNIDAFSEHSAIFSCETDSFQMQPLGFLHGSDYVRRIAASADANGYVPRAAQRLDLSDKDFFESVIVAHCGEYRRIRSQRHSWKRPAFHNEAPNKLGSEVLRIRRATSVPEEKECAAGGEAIDNHAGRFDDCRTKVTRDLSSQFCAFSKRGTDFRQRYFAVHRDSSEYLLEKH